MKLSLWGNGLPLSTQLVASTVQSSCVRHTQSQASSNSPRNTRADILLGEGCGVRESLVGERHGEGRVCWDSQGQGSLFEESEEEGSGWRESQVQGSLLGESFGSLLVERGRWESVGKG